MVTTDLPVASSVFFSDESAEGTADNGASVDAACMERVLESDGTGGVGTRSSATPIDGFLVAPIRAEYESDDPESGPAALPNVPQELPDAYRSTRLEAHLSSTSESDFLMADDAGSSQVCDGQPDEAASHIDEDVDTLDASMVATLPLSAVTNRRSEGAAGDAPAQLLLSNGSGGGWAKLAMGSLAKDVNQWDAVKKNYQDRRSLSNRLTVFVADLMCCWM